MPPSSTAAAVPVPRPSGRVRILVGCFLLLLCAIMAVRTLHWPWSNDAQVFHYAVFLMGRGFAPYRQIVDLNLPGSYLSEWLGMHLARSTDLSYRLYDLLLLAVFGWASIVIAKPINWFAGLLAATLFALIHGSEGAWMLAERDFVMAVLLACACALTFSATRQQAAAHPRTAIIAKLFAAATLVALACTLKPFAAVYALPLFGLALPALPKAMRTGAALGLLAGASLVLTTTLAFLLWRSSLTAFLQNLSLAAGYSGPHRTPFTYMLHHSTPRGLLLLLPPVLYLAIRRRSWRNPERLTLQISAVLGLGSYFIQNKGFIYHRYPLVAFALLWVTLECTEALQSLRASALLKPDALLADATLITAIVVVAPFYLYRVFHMPAPNAFALGLVDDIRILQQTQPDLALDTHIQCLDGIAGCYSALYRLQLASSTGLMGDQLLFQPVVTPAVSRARALFQQQLSANPPTVFVETNYWYGGPQQFTKTATWPAFDFWLHAHYTAIRTRTFPQRPGEPNPIGYRIYLRRP